MHHIHWRRGCWCRRTHQKIFSILFQKSSVFEDGLLTFDASALEKKHYFLMGRMVAMSVLLGHPGPTNLENHLVDYILTGKTPSIADIPVDVVKRQDVAIAINEVFFSITHICCWAHLQRVIHSCHFLCRLHSKADTFCVACLARQTHRDHFVCGVVVIGVTLLCSGNISKSIRDTNLKLHRWIDLIEKKCNAKEP